MVRTVLTVMLMVLFIGCSSGTGTGSGQQDNISVTKQNAKQFLDMWFEEYAYFQRTYLSQIREDMVLEIEGNKSGVGVITFNGEVLTVFLDNFSSFGKLYLTGGEEFNSLYDFLPFVRDIKGRYDIEGKFKGTLIYQLQISTNDFESFEIDGIVTIGSLDISQDFFNRMMSY